MNKIAQINIAPNGGYKGLGDGPLSDPVPAGVDFVFANFISMVIGTMTLVAIIWFIFVFISGAIGIISSSGDKNALESAKKKISTGVIGLVIVIIATFAIDLIGFMLGFEAGGILNFNDLFIRLLPGSPAG